MSENQPHKVHLVSLGCPKNTVDSERMLGLLQGHAYQMTDVPEEADVVVVNTCGFIEPAKEESLAAIMDAHRLKQEGQCEGVIVTGCLSTRYYEELAQELVEADKLLTIADEADIVHHVDDVLGVQRPQYLASLPRTSLTPKHWSYLRISDGCDHQCAFCAIPAIRGRHVSEPVEQLVAEAERLAAEGVRELVLVSQDSVRYGADLYGRPQLVRLLQALAEVEGIEWMRLMYTYPAFWTEELINFYAACDKMCRYIDMPLQHISDPVLKRMKRATTRQKTLDLLAWLRERLPGAGLRSTFIVGFPGETEDDFAALLEFVAETRFDYATGFLYSPEDGTSAYELRRSGQRGGQAGALQPPDATTGARGHGEKRRARRHTAGGFGRCARGGDVLWADGARCPGNRRPGSNHRGHASGGFFRRSGDHRSRALRVEC